MIALKSIVVATDFSEPSATALEYGRALARTFNATLHVVHVVENFMVPGMMGETVPDNYAELLDGLEAAAEKRLRASIGDDDRRELGAQTLLLKRTTAAQGIVAYAENAKVDLIVMGTHGRGRWSQLLMGSVAEKVVRTAPCPVLTVRHPERDFIAPDALQVVGHADK